MTEHVPTPHLTDPTVLVTLTGADQSGVSTRLFEQLAGFEIEVIDVEQLIVRGRLVLSALVTVPGDDGDVRADDAAPSARSSGWRSSSSRASATTGLDASDAGR